MTSDSGPTLTSREQWFQMWPDRWRCHPDKWRERPSSPFHSRTPVGISLAVYPWIQCLATYFSFGGKGVRVYSIGHRMNTNAKYRTMLTMGTIMSRANHLDQPTRMASSLGAGVP